MNKKDIFISSITIIFVIIMIFLYANIQNKGNDKTLSKQQLQPISINEIKKTKNINIDPNIGKKINVNEELEINKTIDTFYKNYQQAYNKILIKLGGGTTYFNDDDDVEIKKIYMDILSQINNKEEKLTIKDFFVKMNKDKKINNSYFWKLFLKYH